MTLREIQSSPRVTIRREGEPSSDGKCVVYWMQRAQRALDNPALETAILAANELKKPVVVFLGLVPFYPSANARHYAFLAQGIPDLARGLKERGIGFIYRPYPRHSLERFCKEVSPSLVIGDENPLRLTEAWRKKAASLLSVPFWTVDADVIVPSKLLLKEHFAARTIRPKIKLVISEYLKSIRAISPVVRWRKKSDLESVSPMEEIPAEFNLSQKAGPVSDIVGGTNEGVRKLKRFIREGLAGYSENRNHPESKGTSQLSPYLHFGHLSPLTVALAVSKADAPKADRDAYLEELIVRRELAINFVRFNPNYDSIKCAEPWAKKTIQEHANDPRAYLYSENQFEQAETHDPLWNAAQIQMVKTGWMHGYVRMYWAKKILEWSPTAAEAFDIAVKLNDTYELDGRDPNGYAGVAWAIAGKHDRAWGPERPIYGKIRYMSYASTSRKFNSKAYMKLYA